MSQSKQIIEAQAAVDTLVDQYHQDLQLIDDINKLKSRRMTEAAKLSKERGIGLRDILRDQTGYPTLVAIDKAESELSRRQQVLWDSMLYPNPIIWMMYKYQAYQGGQNEIATMDDFRKHCSPKGYICSSRYHFLRHKLKNLGYDLDDSSAYPGSTSLPDIYMRPEFTKLTDDNAFLYEWAKYEFHKTSDGRVAKWENYAPKPAGKKD